MLNGYAHQQMKSMTLLRTFEEKALSLMELLQYQTRNKMKSLDKKQLLILGALALNPESTNHESMAHLEKQIHDFRQTYTYFLKQQNKAAQKDIKEECTDEKWQQGLCGTDGGENYEEIIPEFTPAEIEAFKKAAINGIEEVVDEIASWEQEYKYIQDFRTDFVLVNNQFEDEKGTTTFTTKITGEMLPNDKIIRFSFKTTQGDYVQTIPLNLKDYPFDEMSYEQANQLNRLLRSFLASMKSKFKDMIF